MMMVMMDDGQKRSNHDKQTENGTSGDREVIRLTPSYTELAKKSSYGKYCLVSDIGVLNNRAVSMANGSENFSVCICR